jgi:UDP-N-acetylglucosamine:LPS N-acetylglucosamine transferase
VVLNAEGDVPADVAPRVLRIVHAERDWRVAWNFVEALRILLRYRPRMVASPGAGCAVPFAVWCRLLAIPYVHVEPRSAVRRLTLTGRIVRRFARAMIVQWPTLRASHPRAECHAAFPASSS